MMSHKIIGTLRHCCKSRSLFIPAAQQQEQREKTGVDNIPLNPKSEKSINQVTLLGRVGAEPQKRGTEKHPVVVFSLATQISFKYESGEYNQKTEWHRICVFKPTLRDTVYNYLRKGQRVHVTGRLSYGEVKDDQGNPKPTTAIVADDVIFFQSFD